jgi:hypothetical protein
MIKVEFGVVGSGGGGGMGVDSWKKEGENYTRQAYCPCMRARTQMSRRDHLQLSVRLRDCACVSERAADGACVRLCVMVGGSGVRGERGGGEGGTSVRCEQSEETRVCPPPIVTDQVRYCENSPFILSVITFCQRPPYNLFLYHLLPLCVSASLRCHCVRNPPL